MSEVVTDEKLHYHLASNVRAFVFSYFLSYYSHFYFIRFLSLLSILVSSVLSTSLLSQLYVSTMFPIYVFICCFVFHSRFLIYFPRLTCYLSPYFLIVICCSSLSVPSSEVTNKQHILISNTI
jgi:hypothetical protein